MQKQKKQGDKQKIIKFACNQCDGTGQDFEYTDKYEFILTDCLECGGTGKIPLVLKDKRKVSKYEPKRIPSTAGGNY
jgi:DnaJ-class molecular chaperone